MPKTSFRFEEPIRSSIDENRERGGCNALKHPLNPYLWEPKTLHDFVKKFSFKPIISLLHVYLEPHLMTFYFLLPHFIHDLLSNESIFLSNSFWYKDNLPRRDYFMKNPLKPISKQLRDYLVYDIT